MGTESPAQRRIIGIDLDNTLVCYDELFHRIGVEQELVEPSLERSKEIVRNAIRLLPDGEAKWTRLQAFVYGSRMFEAAVFPGAERFLEHCAENCVRTFIVSHKTAFASLDGKQLDLREAARAWLQAQGFAGKACRLRAEDVFFESTRTQKIERIRSLGCTHFIDDLTEVFAEPEFPAETEKLLFAPHGAKHVPPNVRVFTSWSEITRFFFE